MGRKDPMDNISLALFDASVELSEADHALMLRLRDAYTVWIDKPTMSDLQMRDYLMVTNHYSRQQASNDISRVKILLGNVTVASKEFFRHKVNTILDKAFIAAEAGNDRQAKVLAKIAEGFQNNNRTNEDDGDQIPYDQIVPRDWSFSVDPTVAGVKLIPGIKEKAERLRKKYEDDFEIETPYEEITDDNR